MSYPSTVGQKFVPPKGTNSTPPASKSKEGKDMRLNKNNVESDNLDTYTRVRMALNGAKTLEPLLLGIMRHPGVANDPERLEEATDKIIELHQNVTSAVQEKLAPGNKNAALRASIATSLAHLVGNVWNADNENLDAGVLADMFMKTVKFSEATPDIVFTDLPRATDKALERSKAVSRCIPTLAKIDALPQSAQNLFMGKCDNFSDRVNLFRDEVERRASSIAENICPANASDKQKNIVYKSILNRVAQTTSDLLDIEYRAMGRGLKAAKKSGKHKDKDFVNSLTQSPDGELSKRVFTQVDRALADMFPAGAQEDMREDNTHAMS